MNRKYKKSYPIRSFRIDDLNYEDLCGLQDITWLSFNLIFKELISNYKQNGKGESNNTSDGK